MIEQEVRSYIGHYLTGDHIALGRSLKKIQDSIYGLGHPADTGLFRQISSIVLDHPEFNREVTGSDPQASQNIELYLDHFAGIDSLYLLTDLLLYPPDLLLIALKEHTPQEILATPHYPQELSKSKMDFRMGASSSRPVNFYLTDPGNRYPDLYLGRSMPFNGQAEQYAYDYHLPLQRSILKYHPNRGIRLCSERPESGEGKYIYHLSPTDIAGLLSDFRGEFIPRTLPVGVLKDLGCGKALVVYNSLNEGFSLAPYFHFLSYSIRSKVPGPYRKNILFLSGNSYDEELSGRFNSGKPFLLKQPVGMLKNYLESKSGQDDPLRVMSSQFFESAVKNYFRDFYPDRDPASRMKALAEAGDNLRHFLCLNRVVKKHRLKLSWFFWSERLMDKVYISQDRAESTQLKELGPTASEVDAVQDFNASLPWKLDSQTFTTNLWNRIPEKALDASLIWIVTETNFETERKRQAAFLTEKTFKPMAFHMPFIIVGSPGTLKKLRQLGYRTFSKWWDESYDESSNHIRRFELVTQVIRQLSNRPVVEMLSMLTEMEEVLAHNHQVLMKSTADQRVVEAVLGVYDQLTKA